MAALEAEEETEAMEKQFPTPEPAGFDMGMGHVSAPEVAQYGRLTVVNRTARVCHTGEPVSRSAAAAIFEARGINYDSLFYTARFWCAGRYE